MGRRPDQREGSRQGRERNVQRVSCDLGQPHGPAQHGKTSPEELLAAAHAACYSMAFSNGLSKAGHKVERLNTTAEVEFVPGPGITTVTITTVGRVAGIDAAEFQKEAEAAKEGCPVSKALHGNVTPQARRAPGGVAAA